MFEKRKKKLTNEYTKAMMDEVKKEPTHQFTMHIPESQFYKFKAKIATDKNYKTMAEAVRGFIDNYLNS